MCPRYFARLTPGPTDARPPSTAILPFSIASASLLCKAGSRDQHRFLESDLHAYPDQSDLMDIKPAVDDDSASGNSLCADQAQLDRAMQRLKLLYIKSRALRDTIPRIIEPLVQKHTSPPAADVMFNAFIKAVDDAQSGVKEFAELMRDEETKQVFARADKSREENPFGIVSWRHKDHPDWCRMDT